MNLSTSRLGVTALVVMVFTMNVRADEYAVDPVHSGATFRALHFGLTWIPGRFKEVSGKLSIDANNPAATRFDLSAKVDSIDTNNAKRDEHLKSADFFDAKQYPVVTFRSSSAKHVNGSLEVVGDLTLHGITKPITVIFKGGKAVEFPKGVQRTGYTADFTIKRSTFGMGKMLEAVGDDIPVQFAIEATKK